MMKIKYLEYIKPEEGDIFAYSQDGIYPDRFVEYKEMPNEVKAKYTTSSSLLDILDIAKEDASEDPIKSIAIYSDRSGIVPNSKDIPVTGTLQEYREFFIKYATGRFIIVSRNVGQVYCEVFELYLDTEYDISRLYIFDYNVLYGGARLKEDGTLYRNKLTGEIGKANFANYKSIDNLFMDRDIVVHYEVDGHILVSAEAEEVEVANGSKK